MAIDTKSMFDELRTKSGEAYKRLANGARGAYGSMQEAMPGVKATISGAVQGVKDALPGTRQAASGVADAARDLYNKGVSGARAAMPGVSAAMDTGVEAARDLGSRMRDGVRGTASVAPSASAGTSVVPYDPVVGQAHAPAREFSTAERNAALRAQNNPYLQTPEGQAAVQKAQGVGVRAAAPQGPGLEEQLAKARPGKAATGMLSKASRVLGAVGLPVLAAQTAMTDTDEFRQDIGAGQETNVGRGLRSVGVPENAARFGDDVAVRALGTFNNALGGLPEMILGGSQRSLNNAQVVPPAAAQTSPMGQPNVGPQFQADQLQADQPVGARDELASAQDMLSNGAPIPKGTGVFQVGKNAPVRIDTRDKEPVKAAGPRGAFDVIAGLTPKIARLKSEQARDSGRLAEAELGTKTLANQIAGARLGIETGNKNREVVQNRVKDIAKTYGPANGKPDEVKQANERETSDIMKRFEYTVGTRSNGKTIETLTPKETNELVDADKIRRKVQQGHNEFFQSMRDFFGQKRFDSDNLDTYRPVAKEGSVIYFAGGNSINLTTLAGGKFNALSPNDPVNTDLQNLTRGLPTRAELAKKGARSG